MANTAVFGVMFVDIKCFPFGKYTPKGRNLGDIKFIHGGVSRNIAEDFANVGADVTFVTMAENSAIGKEALDNLKKAGVDLEYVKNVEENAMGMWVVILNDEGDVAGQISKMPDITALSEFIDEKGDEIVRNCKNVILEFDMGEEISEKILTLAEKYGKSVYSIVGNMSVILKRRDFVKRTDCFICNEIEISNLLEKDLTNTTPDEMANELCYASDTYGYPSMVVTMGKNGAAYFDKKTREKGHYPAKKVKLVDSSGAGDAFLSGTVIGLSNGFSLGNSVVIGTYMASLTIQCKQSACPKTDVLSRVDIEEKKLVQLI